MNYKRQIKIIEDVFFDVKSPKYADIELFSEIFKILDNPDFREKQPDVFESELKRIRDIKNSIDTAREEGIERRKIKIVKEMLNDGESIEKIFKYTGLTLEQIENVKNEI